MTAVPSEAVIFATRWRTPLFLAFVVLLPLHTVFFSAWVSWKPYMILLIIIAGIDVITGLQTRTWPWHRSGSWALVIFLALVLAGWPGVDHGERFVRLFLALVVGGLVLLVTERALRQRDVWERMMRAIFWSSAVMAVTAVVLAAISVGAFGSGAIDAVNDLPFVHRVAKRAYLDEGFLALTNWHQDPGYAAAWMNLWAVLALMASCLGFGSDRRWLDTAVLGGLGLGVIMTFSRTGWVGLVAGMTIAAFVLVRVGNVSVAKVATRVLGAGVFSLALVGLLAVADRPGVGGDLDDQFAFRFDQLATLGSVSGSPSDDPGSVSGFDAEQNRADVWPEYVEFFVDNPLRGIGLGVGWATEGLQEPHNLALELLAETGIIGFAGFLLLLAVVLRGRGWLGRVALITAFAAALTQTVLFEPTWWFAAGLLLAGGGAGLMVAEQRTSLEASAEDPKAIRKSGRLLADALKSRDGSVDKH